MLLLRLQVRILRLLRLFIILCCHKRRHLMLVSLIRLLVVFLGRSADFPAVLVGDLELTHPFLFLLVQLFELVVLALIRTDSEQ